MPQLDKFQFTLDGPCTVTKLRDIFNVWIEQGYGDHGVNVHEDEDWQGVIDVFPVSKEGET